MAAEDHRHPPGADLRSDARTRRVAGIDVGGTFTDLVLTETGPAGTAIRVAKVPTSLPNQAEGVLAAIAAAGVSPADLDLVVHGTTATTNAVLERKTARVGLVTTRGFRDTLELGRRTRPRPYGLFGTFEPLVPRELRLEVDERMDARGGVVTPLDEAGVEAAARALLAAGCEAVVVHFLHSYANPAHELRAGSHYEVIVSTQGGLYRYQLGDVVRVDAREVATRSRPAAAELATRAGLTDLSALAVPA